MAEGRHGETSSLPASKAPRKQIFSKARPGDEGFMERKMLPLPVFPRLSGEAWNIPVVQVPLRRHPALPDCYAQLVASVDSSSPLLMHLSVFGMHLTSSRWMARTQRLRDGEPGEMAPTSQAHNPETIMDKPCFITLLRLPLWLLLQTGSWGGGAEGMSSRCAAHITAGFPMAISFPQRNVGAGGPMPAGQWAAQSTPAPPHSIQDLTVDSPSESRDYGGGDPQISLL